MRTNATFLKCLKIILRCPFLLTCCSLSCLYCNRSVYLRSSNNVHTKLASCKIHRCPSIRHTAAFNGRVFSAITKVFSGLSQGTRLIKLANHSASKCTGRHQKRENVQEKVARSFKPIAERGDDNQQPNREFIFDTQLDIALT